MANNFLNLDTDITLGGDNSSNYKAPSSLSVKTYVDNHSGSLVPNEIPSGTVYEGKFSELPEFLESLEGKYCKGTVTFKVTEDEVIDDSRMITTENNTNHTILPLYIPIWDIKEVIIDCNEKSITCDRVPTSWDTFIGIFSIFDKGLDIGYPGANTNSNDRNQLLTFTNGTFNCLKTGNSYDVRCFMDNTNINIVYSKLTIYSSSCGVTNYGGRVLVTGCEFNGNTAIDAGAVRVSHFGELFAFSNIVNNYRKGYIATSSGIIRVVNTCYTNTTNELLFSNGGSGNLLRETTSVSSTRIVNGGNTSDAGGWKYN